MKNTIIEVFAILSGAISGGCLAAIQLRKKLPLLGAIFSPKLKEELDSIDKRLAITALIFFLFCMVFTIIFLW